MGDELKDRGETEAKKARQRTYLVAAVILGSVLFAIPIISAPSNYAWTGLGPHKVPSGEVVPGKTLWDWLGLFVIPATLAIGGYWFSSFQKDRDEKLADRRTKEEREISEERTQETALQTYLDQMSKLLIDKKLISEPEPETRGQLESGHLR